MDTIFMNSENSKTSEYQVLVLKVTDKLDLRRGQKTVALSNLSIYYTWKNIKSSYNNNMPQCGAKNLSYQMDQDIQDYFEYIFKETQWILKVLIIKFKIELRLKLKMDIILSF